MRHIVEDKRKGKLDEARALIIEKMRGEFDELGLTLEEVFPPRRPRGERKSLAVKYRGPNGETWSGRGFKSAWLRKLEDEGHDIEEYLVKDE
jgi:DNA-binding protein H-NS